MSKPEPEIPFDQWWAELNELADRRGLSFLLSPAKEDHRDGWADGLSPEDELYEQAGAANC